MRVLFDSCVSALAKNVLDDAGHDVIWVGDWPRDPGDQEILTRALGELRILVTIDKDFGELIIVRGQLHVGLIRLIGFRASQQGQATLRLLQAYEEPLAKAAIVTAEPWRVRIRQDPQD